jgi:hypothetical protein
MTITQNNYERLLDHNLEYNDLIVFPYKFKETSVQYSVKTTYLSPEFDFRERYVLEMLQEKGYINDIILFLTACYGYNPKGHTSNDDSCWPDTKHGDYAALTRTVYRIFDFIVGGKDVIKIPLTSLSIKID